MADETKRYIPSRFMNKITFRKPQRVSPFSTVDLSIEQNFATWEEARAFLVTEREAEFEAAKQAMQRAARRFSAARLMEQKLEANNE